MKKYVEILHEIETLRASITDTAKSEKDLDRLAMVEAYKDGSDAEKEKARARYKAAEARYIEECAHNEDIKIKIEILKDNAKQALLSENIGTICDIWNKYEGKPHGEKTADKIRAELRAAVGFRVWIRNRFDEANITIYFDCGSGAPFSEVEFCPRWNGEKQPATNNNNKIVKLTPENFRVYVCGEYVEDVNAHAEALREAHRAALEAEKALENAVSAYNALTRGKINHASTREGVKKWFI